MTKSQEEFYKFVVAPENFEAICDIVDNFPAVQEKLIYDFWVEVKAKCELLLKGKQGWITYMTPFENVEPEFSIYRKEYGPKNSEDVDVAIGIDGFYSQAIFGMNISFEPKIFNKERLLKIAKENKKAGWRFGTSFPYYKLLPEDFSEVSNLKKIHPDNRASLVQHYASEITDAVKEFEPFINKHILKAK